MFVVVIIAIASTRPVVGFAESALRRVAVVGGATPAAWRVAILTIGPVLGSFITEPAAMTICALLLARQFFDLPPSTRLKYATLGVLFVKRLDWWDADAVRGAAGADGPPWITKPARKNPTSSGVFSSMNAPNPAGQALLGRFFDGAILPIGLLAGALLPTIIAAIVFRLL